MRRFLISLSLLTVATLAVVSLGAGCFDAPKPNCAFLCGPASTCPDSYACGNDLRCHLDLGGGQLATCDDTLPGDGGAIDGATDASTVDGQVGIDSGPIIDASPGTPDAMVDAAPGTPDAMPADANVDAGPVNASPVLGSVANATVLAGTLITRVFTATDADVGQTLTFNAQWPGTSRNPFAARPGAATDTVGGAFDGTDTFTLDTTCLGRYDLLVSVADGAGGNDSQGAAFIVNAAPLKVNEIQLGSTIDLQNVELVNTGSLGVDPQGVRVCTSTLCFAIPAGHTLAGGDVLVLHNDVGTDDVGNVFAVGLTGLDGANTVLLLDGTSDLSKSCKMLDFVAWDASVRGAQAVFAGQWQNAADAVDVTDLTMPTYTIARTAGANTESNADFFIDTTPTIGAPNN